MHRLCRSCTKCPKIRVIIIKRSKQLLTKFELKTMRNVRERNDAEEHCFIKRSTSETKSRAPSVISHNMKYGAIIKKQFPYRRRRHASTTVSFSLLQLRELGKRKIAVTLRRRLRRRAQNPSRAQHAYWITEIVSYAALRTYCTSAAVARITKAPLTTPWDDIETSSHTRQCRVVRGLRRHFLKPRTIFGDEDNKYIPWWQIWEVFNASVSYTTEVEKCGGWFWFQTV